MNTYGGNIKVFSCNANIELAQAIAKCLGLKLGVSEVSRFSDGEISIRIDETIRGADVFIVQPTSHPVNENIMELLIMTDAMRRASAGRITAVMPYYGYARQDRKARARDPISAKLVADILTTAGVDRVLTMDLHSDQLQGFFDIPVDHLRGMPLFAKYCKERFPDMSNVIAVSPDLGSVARARSFAGRLNIPLAIVDKRRPKPNVSEVMNIIGEVEGKQVILIDDMADTAGSLTGAAKALVEHGAVSVYACCTHAILSGPALEKLENSSIKELIVLDTIKLPTEKLERLSGKIKVLTVSHIFADAISRIHDGLSVSTLFS